MAAGCSCGGVCCGAGWRRRGRSSIALDAFHHLRSSSRAGAAQRVFAAGRLAGRVAHADTYRRSARGVDGNAAITYRALSLTRPFADSTYLRQSGAKPKLEHNAFSTAFLPFARHRAFRLYPASRAHALGRARLVEPLIRNPTVPRLIRRHQPLEGGDEKFLGRHRPSRSMAFALPSIRLSSAFSSSLAHRSR